MHGHFKDDAKWICVFINERVIYSIIFNVKSLNIWVVEVVEQVDAKIMGIAQVVGAIE